MSDNPLDDVNKAIDKAGEDANKAINNAGSEANKGINEGREAANNAVNNVSSVPNNAIDTADDTAKNATTTAKDTANNAIKSAQSVVENAVDKVQSTVKNAEELVKNTVGNAVDSAKNVANTAKNAVDSVSKKIDGLSNMAGGLGNVSNNLGGLGGASSALSRVGALSVSGPGGLLGGGGGGISIGSSEKATLVNLDDRSKSVKCHFNPKEYTISKQNKWSRGKEVNENSPHFEFSNGEPMILKVQLFFDTTETQSDVRGRTQTLFDFMMVDDRLKDPKTKKSRPPMVALQWGNVWTFESVITSVSQKFTLFNSNGTPLRATVDVTLQQVSDPSRLPPQNPTSGGVGGERVWSVKSGDTLAWIAYKVYGDSTRWRLIADANHLDNVRRLTPGMQLVIPNA
ncbi:MAG TPA: LysM peptidoglycan-binding domain-containing protein [Roseiflexaceae bacterium]|nr:LysM peptidoglycan-binding domain-containing protein [Roseiflexaceae bacterium]